MKPLFTWPQKATRLTFLCFLMMAGPACPPVWADGWAPWPWQGITYSAGGSAGAQMVNDGTNLYFSTALSGIWTVPIYDGDQFSEMSLNGFPAWDPNVNTNGMAVCSLGLAPQGTLVIGGEVVNVVGNTLDYGTTNATSNALPVFYWWDATNEIWQPALIIGKSYPYTVHVGNFYNAPDGSLWTCSGYASYVYRSTDDGHSYMAFDINARVPASYSPQPFNGTNAFSAGKIFSLAIGANGEVVIGTETGGFMHSLDNGQSWTSLDPNYTNTNSINPLGRAGDGRVVGLDRFGDFICRGSGFTGGSPAQAQWAGVTNTFLYHPADGSYVPIQGILGNYGISEVVTTPNGISFSDLNQGTNMLGGVYISYDGTNWSQFNTNLPMVSTNVGDALAAGGCITLVSNYVIIGGYYLDYTTLTNVPVFTVTPPVSPPPPPRPVLTNFPPVGLGQDFVLSPNGAVSFTLTSVAAAGDPLHYKVTVPPAKGALAGTLPSLTFTPTNNPGGLDSLLYTVDDGIYTSGPVAVNFAFSNPSNPPPTLTFTTSAANGWILTPSNLVLTAIATAPGGINQVRFYNGNTQLAFLTHSPYVYTWTNPPVGEYSLSARAGANLEASTWSAPLTVVVLTNFPKLSIQPAKATNVNVTWSGNTNGFYLFTAPDPTGPWSLCSQPPLFTNNTGMVTMPATNRQCFRLLHP